MKRVLRTFLLILALGALLCVAVLATNDPPEKSGIYQLEVKSGYAATVTAVPQTTTGNAVASEATIDEMTETFYEDAVKLNVTYTGAEVGKYYLVLATSDGQAVPTTDNLVYIDQTTAGTTSVSFNVYPSDLTSGKTYAVCLASNAEGGAVAIVATFKYYVPYVLGDVDGEDGINISDAMEVIYHIVGKNTLTGSALLAADTTGDGQVNISDAMEIIYYIVGKPEYLN